MKTTIWRRMPRGFSRGPSNERAPGANHRSLLHLTKRPISPTLNFGVLLCYYPQLRPLQTGPCRPIPIPSGIGEGVCVRHCPIPTYFLSKNTSCGALDLGLHGCSNAGTEMSQFTDLQLINGVGGFSQKKITTRQDSDE